MNSKASISGRTNYNGYLATRPAIIGLAKVLFLSLCQISTVAAAPLVDAWKDHEHNHDTPDADDVSLWLYLAVAVVLVLLGGAFAGLTIALMGQDGIYLQVISTSGEGKEQRHAEKVLNLLKKGKHWVLVTLLLSNVIVNETLPIILDRSLGGGWPAVLGSTALIVIFGEVIPQSICVRYGLSIGAFMAPCVLALMWLLSPIAWPTAKLLDKLLGEDHGTVYKKSGLKTLVTLHKTLGNSPTDRLNQDEVTIISAVLDLKDKAVGHIMTPMEDVFTMCEDEVLDEETMNNILSAGYSRIPIHKADNDMNFVGMLLVKILITYDPEDCKKVSDFALATLPETRPETSCLDIINFFQEGKSHMVMVSEFPGENYGAQGVVTLEDVIEELIGEEIIDESDVYIDVHKAIRRMAPAPKARVHKGHVIDKSSRPITTAMEGDLIDLSGGQAIDTIKRVANGDNRSHSPLHTHTPFGTSPKTTFLKRSTSGQDSQPIAVRGNVNDMREQLKHLGPSNVASRPKTTRYQTVKIKLPGAMVRSNSMAESTGYTHSIIDEPYHDDPSVHGGEGEGLLKSAGMHAKDGVQALQQGYGSLNYSTSPKNARTEIPIVAEGASFQAPTPRKSFRDYSPAVLSRNHSDRSSDTLKSLHAASPQPWKRGTARSGSITENIIESGGFQKVVLQTTSESDIEASGESSRSKKSESNSPTGLLKPSINQTNYSNGQVEQNGTEKGEEVKKKRRRQRKKKGTKTGDGSTGGESSTVGEEGSTVD